MKVAVLGAGFAGLGAALRLSEKHEVILIEKLPSLGGVVASVDYEGAKIPWGSHWILSTDKALVNLIRELGLENKLKWKNVRMGFFYKKGIYGIASPLELLAFAPLPFFARIRFGLFGLRILLSGGSWTKKLEGKSAKRWLLEEAGKDVCENLFEPLAKIKFNQSLDEVSASWLYNRLADTAKGGEKYGFLEGGFETLLEAIGGKIGKNGGNIIHGANVNKISIKNGRASSLAFVHDGKEKTIEVDGIVSALPIPVLLKAAELPNAYREQLARVKYKYIINAFFVLDKKLVKDFDWVNYCYDDLPFGGTLEHEMSVYKPKDNGSLLYVFTYLNGKDSLWEKTKEEIKNIYIGELEKIYPGITKIIRHAFVEKSNLAWPIYDKDYGSYMPTNKTPVDGLYLAGIFTTYPKMPSTGVAAESGYEAARLVEGGR